MGDGVDLLARQDEFLWEACWRIPEGRGDGIGHGWRKRYSWFQSRCRLLKLDVTFVTSCKGCAKEWLSGCSPRAPKSGAELSVATLRLYSMGFVCFSECEQWREGERGPLPKLAGCVLYRCH